jgi:hypothetical protein
MIENILFNIACLIIAATIEVREPPVCTVQEDGMTVCVEAKHSDTLQQKSE